MTQQASQIPVRAKMSLDRLMQAAQEIESPRILQKWALLFAMVSGLVSMMLAAALVILLPTREIVPFFLVERSDASVVVSDVVGARFQPSDSNVQYFAFRFTRNLLTIDEQMRFNLPASYEFTRGAATSQWREFVQTTDRPQARLTEDPSLRRMVEIEGTPQIIAATEAAQSGSVAIFMRETTTTARAGQSVRRVRVTLDYVIGPPASLDQALRNPIGFFVTNIRYEVIN